MSRKATTARRQRQTRRTRAARRLPAMRLGALRQARCLTQAALSAKLAISQGDVSKIEGRTDCYVSTLRGYVAALGGALEIVARFPDGVAVRIDQFDD